MEHLRLFYTGNANDIRGEVYTHLAFNGMEYTKAINDEKLEFLVNEPLFQYMLKINYKNGNTDKYNILSNDFIQFIIDVGKFHAKLDDGNSIASNNIKEQIFNNVYKGNSVKIEVKKLFLTFLHVVDIASNRVVTNFDSISDLSTVRFNLAKLDVSAENKNKILFAETIPLLVNNLAKDDDMKLYDTTNTYKDQFTNKLVSIVKFIKDHPYQSAAIGVAAAATGAATVYGLSALVSSITSTFPFIGPTLSTIPNIPTAMTAVTADAVATAGVDTVVIESVRRLPQCFNVLFNNATSTIPMFTTPMFRTRLGLPGIAGLNVIAGGGNDNDMSTLLRDLYYACYGDFPVLPIGEKVLELKSSKNTKFDVDLTKLTLNALKARDTRVRVSPVSSQQIGFDDLYESVVTGVRYVRDSDGVLRKLNDDNTLGAKFDDSELDEVLKPNTSNCGSTGIKYASCEEVYKCLLSGKPESLSDCLGNLANKNMFDVARREVANMHPKIAVQLLKTFGFKLRKEGGSNIIMPCTFDEWLQRLNKSVDAETSAAIRENKKLLEYLKSVVEIVRANPAIINKDLRHGVVSDYAKKYGLSVYRNPFPERKVSPSVVDGLLFAPQQLTQSMQLPLALQIANVSGRVHMPFQMGGGKDECPNASNFRQSFNMIFAEMEKNGKVLVDSDKARINATIDKIDKLESQLIRLMDDAKIYSKLNAATSIDNTNENITLNDITNVSVSNFNENILKNIRKQSQLSEELIYKVQMPLLQLLIK